MSRTLLTAASAAMLAGAAGLHHAAGTVTIVCRLPGMRRNGIRHPAVETYPADRWTDDELDAFNADPNFTVRYEAVSSAAPGADTADAVQDQGAGAPTPDLGAKPNGTGPSAPVVTAAGEVRPAVLDESRVAAIRGRLADLGVFLRYDDYAPGDVFDFLRLTEDQWLQMEALVGFRPSIPELEAALPRYVPTPVVQDPLTDDTPGGALDETRVTAIRAVLGQLTPAEFTGAGKPALAALEQLLGWMPRRAEVDAATTPVPDPAV